MIRLLLAACFALSLNAGAQAGNPKAKKIVIIGDSISEGYGVNKAQSYPSLMQKKADAAGLQWNIINGGISGSTTSSALSRINWHLTQKPDLMVLAVGANDGLRGIDPKLIETNLATAIEEIKKAKIKVLLVGMKLPPNYGIAYIAKYQMIWPRLASRFKVPIVPFLLDGVAGNPALNQADGIHPNEKGHEIIADLMYSAVKSNL